MELIQFLFSFSLRVQLKGVILSPAAARATSRRSLLFPTPVSLVMSGIHSLPYAVQKFPAC